MKGNIADNQVLHPSIPYKVTADRRALLICAFMLLLFAAPGLRAQTVGGGGFLPNPVQIVSTVPTNGDGNPYGVAFVPIGFPNGVLNAGDILVSNFNNSQNLQGTGTTIVRVTPTAQASLFFTAQPG